MCAVISRPDNSSLARVRTALAEFSGRPLSFLVGEPWYEPPEALKAAFSAAVLSHGTAGYSLPAGDPECRDLLAEREVEASVRLSAENVVIGNGSKSLLYGLCNVLKPRCALVTRPWYPGHRNQIAMCGAQIIEVDGADTGGILDPDRLNHLRSRPDLIVISSPGNPDGTHYTADQFRSLVEWCRQHETTLVVDEVYIDLSFQPERGSVLNAIDDLKNVIVVRSFSKSLGICGWRFGYAIASAALITSLSLWQQHALNPPAKPVQKAITEFLTRHEFDTGEIVEGYRSTSQILSTRLKTCGYTTAAIDGGLYLMVRVPEPAMARFHGDDVEFCTALARQQGVAFWPGSDYGLPGYCRLSFAGVAPDEAESVGTELERRLDESLV